MCTIALAIAGVGVAIQAAQSMSQYAGQQQQYDAQVQQNQIEANNIYAATRNNYLQAQQQMQYHNDEAEQKLANNAAAARAARATAMTSAGETGVSGISVSALQQEYESRQGEFAANVEYNRKSADAALSTEMTGFEAQGNSSLNRMRSPVAPSLLSPLLSIGADVAGSYGKLFPDPGTGNELSPNFGTQSGLSR